MAPKKKKQGLLDDMVDSFALTPWWVPAIATVAIFILISAIHWPLPWVWAGVVLLTGVVGQLTRLERRGLVAKTKTIDHLKGLSWSRFEQLVAEAYRQRGYCWVPEIDHRMITDVQGQLGTSRDIQGRVVG